MKSLIKDRFWPLLNFFIFRFWQKRRRPMSFAGSLLTLFLCSFWYKSTGIFEFLKWLFGAIWLFETPFRGWNDFYMDHLRALLHTLVLSTAIYLGYTLGQLLRSLGQLLGSLGQILESLGQLPIWLSNRCRVLSDVIAWHQRINSRERVKRII